MSIYVHIFSIIECTFVLQNLFGSYSQLILKNTTNSYTNLSKLIMCTCYISILTITNYITWIKFFFCSKTFSPILKANTLVLDVKISHSDFTLITVHLVQHAAVCLFHPEIKVDHLWRTFCQYVCLSKSVLQGLPFVSIWIASTM